MYRTLSPGLHAGKMTREMNRNRVGDSVERAGEAHR
jgi:hypothetical protein